MALEGTIKEFGLADIFQLIGLQKKTGTLFLKGSEGTVNVYFEDGMVVKTEDSQMPTRHLFGRILINRGKISEDQLKEAIDTQKSTGQKIGNTLIGLGRVNKDDVRDALNHQMRETIYRTFRWKSGDYKFYQDRVDYDRDTVIPLSCEHILMDGIRMLDEWPLIEKKLPPPDTVLDKKIIDKPSLEEEPEGDIFSGFEDERPGKHGGVSREASTVLELVDGGKSIYEIIELSSLGEFDTCKAIVELLEKGRAVKTGARPEIIEAELPAKQEKARAQVKLERLPYVLAFLALILVFWQVTGTRRIMNPHETKLEDLKEPFAVNQVERVRENSVLYFMDYGAYPESSTALSQLDYIPKADTLDPWGNKLIIRVDKKGDVGVTSPGPDHAPDTSDDIASF